MIRALRMRDTLRALGKSGDSPMPRGQKALLTEGLSVSENEMRGAYPRAHDRVRIPPLSRRPQRLLFQAPLRRDADLSPFVSGGSLGGLVLPRRPSGTLQLREFCQGKTPSLPLPRTAGRAIEGTADQVWLGLHAICIADAALVGFLTRTTGVLCDSRTRSITAQPRFCFSQRCRYTGISSGMPVQTWRARRRWLTHHRHQARLPRHLISRVKPGGRREFAALARTSARRKRRCLAARLGAWEGWLWWSASKARLLWSRNGRAGHSATTEDGDRPLAVRPHGRGLGR